MKDRVKEAAQNWIVFDPSQNYTGWLHYKPYDHKIINYGCIRGKLIADPEKYPKKMDLRMAFQVAFSEELLKIFKFLDPEYTTVVMEEPIGSQNSAAAWGMAMASQGVTSMTVAMFRKPPVTYKERDAKLYAFEEEVVPKSKTAKHMWNYWFGQGIEAPESKWREQRKAEFRKMEEAVADAMLILNLHLHNHHTQS